MNRKCLLSVGRAERGFLEKYFKGRSNMGWKKRTKKKKKDLSKASTKKSTHTDYSYVFLMGFIQFLPNVLLL